MRFAKPGLFGTGIYFANNSGYSSRYCYKTTQKVKGDDGQVYSEAYQMFFCFVVTGETVSLDSQKLNVPPLKTDYVSQVKFMNQEIYETQPENTDFFKNSDRFDSVTNKSNSHYIIYDFNK